ncbi:tetratricopeptide repeat protein [Anaeromyxobacter paludicola]|uniref:Tetratricopeptide repeat protein n=1 Tax=Anaeromyxobacter paludicola TaxID=2918171 RepID=A0ABM7XB02_9BACT|nr:tetratricopeptide repeat protein [Anaeromyxobacter paludicola]BDG09037.1 hypothetical protein AMPC_21500 [Anaeromyxobacter paludicola]
MTEAAAAGGAPPATGQREALLDLGVLCLAVLAAHGLSLAAGFVWDDVHTVQGNPAFAGPGALWRALGMDDWQGYGLHARGVWRPLATLSLFLEHQLFGLRPAGYHAVSLALHAAAAFGVRAVLRALGVRRSLALAAALLFALHPLAAEPADWISAQPDLLAAALALGALWAALAGRPLLGAVLAAAAPFGKEPGLLAIPAVLAVVWTRPGRRRAGPATLAALGGAGAYLWLRHAAGVPQAPLAGALSLAGLGPLLGRLGGAAAGLVSGLLFPLPLDACRRLPALGRAGLPAAGALLLAGAAALLPLRRGRGLPAALACLALGPLPLVALYDADLSERYLYLPLAASCLAAGAGLEALARRLAGRGRDPAPLLAGVMGLLALASLPADAARARDWASPIALFGGAAAADPANPDAQHLLGAALYQAGDRAGALAAFERAEALHGRRAGLFSNLCALRREAGQLERAREDCDRAVAAAPDDPRPRFNRALLLAASGDPARARAELEEVARQHPGYAPARRALAAMETTR